MKPQVLITDFLNDDLAPERRIFGDLANVTALNALTESDLIGRIEDADAVLVYHYLGLSADTINRLRKCRIIVRCGVGFWSAWKSQSERAMNRSASNPITPPCPRCCVITVTARRWWASGIWVFPTATGHCTAVIRVSMACHLVPLIISATASPTK